MLPGAHSQVEKEEGESMSGKVACKCRPRNLVVTQRRCNHSAFSGYRFTPSDYSAVKCLECGQHWRTKAGYVRDFPGAPERWAGMDLDQIKKVIEARKVSGDYRRQIPLSEAEMAHYKALPTNESATPGRSPGGGTVG
jgi:hypothetical protein